jgi:hypothetical protein
MADLELETGQSQKPGIKEQPSDLGKAAFAWKLDLAEVMAEHYYCHAFVDRCGKTVTFIGRPDNVESLEMLYAWVIDQIKRIASEERRAWMAENGHMDPPRWQLNFGLGVVSRIGRRLEELREQQQKDNRVMALVVSHKTEISDYLEAQGHYRIDGQKTKREQEWEKQYAEREAARELLKKTDIEAYYNAYPWERPLTPEQEAAATKREERNARRRKGSVRYRAVDWRQLEQAMESNKAGRSAASKVNLQPFIKDGETKKRKEISNGNA